MQDDGPTSDGSPQGCATGSRGTAGRLGLVGVGAAAVAGYAWWAVGLTSFSVEASIAVLAAGGAAALVGTPRRRTAPVGTRRRRTAPVSGDAWGLVAWGVVVATGQATEIGRIGSLLAEVEKITTPLVQQMDHFSRWLSFLILLVAGLLLVYGYYVWHR